MLKRLFKLVFVLVVLCAAGLAGYAWLGDLSPQTQGQSLTVTLNAN